MNSPLQVVFFVFLLCSLGVFLPLQALAVVADSDEEDEFFDAVEEQEEHPKTGTTQKGTASQNISEKAPAKPSQPSSSTGVWGAMGNAWNTVTGNSKPSEVGASGGGLERSGAQYVSPTDRLQNSAQEAVVTPLSNAAKSAAAVPSAVIRSAGQSAGEGLMEGLAKGGNPSELGEKVGGGFASGAQKSMATPETQKTISETAYSSGYSTAQGAKDNLLGRKPQTEDPQVDGKKKKKKTRDVLKTPFTAAKKYIKKIMGTTGPSKTASKPVSTPQSGSSTKPTPVSKGTPTAPSKAVRVTPKIK